MVDMGFQIDTIGISVVHDAVFRHDHGVIRSLLQFFQVDDIVVDQPVFNVLIGKGIVLSPFQG